MRRLLCGGLALASACASSREIGTCRLGELAATSHAGSANLRDAKAFRNYVAVTAVEPPGYHVLVWYHDVEPVVARVRVTRTSTGALTIESESGAWGGLGVPPEGPAAAPPAELAPLFHELQAELTRRCGGRRDFRLAFAGAGRAVTIREFVAHDVASTRPTRVGWTARLGVIMDPALTRIEQLIDGESGFGVIELPDDAQWIPVEEGTGDVLLLGRAVPPAFLERLGAAARAFEARTPPRALSSLIPADAPLLPSGFDPSLTAKVSLYARRERSGPGAGSSPVDLLANLDLHDAVFGEGAGNTATVTVGETHYTLRATLTPLVSHAPSSAPSTTTYSGLLALNLEDQQRTLWEHTYVASGQIATEGDQVVAPFGLELPGNSSSSPDYPARHARLAAAPPYAVID
ncbi:MAG TPA: hypothetical protein VGP07_09015, partial [Polyangia bacterium]